MERREFFLAIWIFVAMAIFGAGFALWFVGRYAPGQAPVVGDTQSGSPNEMKSPSDKNQ
ncbi:MAG TPA: hypothetical protein VGK20_04680 [Candidatus Binatia bacterium]